jgi:hypothetical protein
MYGGLFLDSDQAHAQRAGDFFSEIFLLRKIET